ncbi:DnaJ-like cysteine-rich domain-containing protein [Franconibacter pulveris 601]|uniref:DnaJ-like cysteine-rich domain-containing protein n=1 Tax=Franconibacter pulveris TaxID=435910 RepID=UPI00046522BC|nr:hypothetical protein [Franconibacter pulveris]
MKDAWLSACDNTIQTFVRDSTRLEPNALKVTPVEYIDFHYQIGLRLLFKAQTSTLHQAGSITAHADTQVYRTRPDYERALQAETSAVLARDKTLDDARARLIANPYGAWRKEEVVYSHPTRICLTDYCDSCRGKGSVNCRHCSGSGKTTCHSCSGSGQVMRQRSYYDHFTKQNRIEHYYESCSGCTGSGRVRCSSCGGSGDERCSPCNGTGVVSQITSIATVGTPDYHLIYPQADVPNFIREGLYKAGLPELAKYGNVQHAQDEVDYARRDVTVMYDASLPFGRLESPLPEADEPIRWILYGVTPHILDAGHVLQTLLKSDLDMLVRQATPGKLLNPWVARASRKTVRTFMESEAHQAMLVENSRGKKGDMLREALNRAFATPYLDEALTSLGNIVGAVQRWSVIKWGLFTALFIYLLAPALVVYQQQGVMDFERARIYLTFPIQAASTDQLLYSLKAVAILHGLPMVAAALCGTVLGYLWRRGWLKRRFGKHLAAWSLEQKRVRNRWATGTLFTLAATLLLFYFFPVWITQDEMLFGMVPMHDLFRQLVQLR